jgi:hypothetical protein
MFVLYQEHTYNYDSHILTPRMRRPAAPTKQVTFIPATTENLGKVLKYVHPGFSAWLVPAGDAFRDFKPEDILAVCTLRVRDGIARKIA